MKGARLKITLEDGEVVIRGDKGGLEYVANVCQRVIGKHDPSGHVHLEWHMNNLCEGSVPAVVQYTDDDEDDKVEA